MYDFMSKLIQLLKKLPIDVGQAEKKHDTAGKRIAFSFVPKEGGGKTALDIGCRDGYWSERLKSLGYVVSALDIEPVYEGALRHNVESGLPYYDKSFDIVWCTEVVEHLWRPASLFAEIERVAKSGAVAVLTTPNSACWFYGALRLFGRTPQSLQNPDHKQFFDVNAITALAAGYDIGGYFPYTPPFFRIKLGAGLLSPTFVLWKKFP